MRYEASSIRIFPKIKRQYYENKQEYKIHKFFPGCKSDVSRKSCTLEHSTPQPQLNTNGLQSTLLKIKVELGLRLYNPQNIVILIHGVAERA